MPTEVRDDENNCRDYAVSATSTDGAIYEAHFGDELRWHGIHIKYNND
jgi:hypothetical protein